ncbi:uncharacterized protein LOC128224524 isoform X2 [Mya arenaria]|nr:uncharacterized protein LOC128224524 isoform X2 [Mya arenaria]
MAARGIILAALGLLLGYKSVHAQTINIPGTSAGSATTTTLDTYTALVPVNIRCVNDPIKGLSCAAEYPDQCREQWNFPNPCTPDNIARNITKFVHPFDSSKFLMCGDLGKLYVVQCPRYELFHEGCGQCVGEQAGLTASCELPLEPYTENPCTRQAILDNKLFFPFPGNLSKFIHCDIWGKAWERICTPGEVWSQWAVACVLPSLLNPCDRPNVDITFMYRHPCDATKYLQCDARGTAYVVPCELGTAFYEPNQRCVRLADYRGTLRDNFCGYYTFGFRRYTTVDAQTSGSDMGSGQSMVTVNLSGGSGSGTGSGSTIDMSGNAGLMAALGQLGGPSTSQGLGSMDMGGQGASTGTGQNRLDMNALLASFEASGKGGQGASSGSGSSSNVGSAGSGFMQETSMSFGQGSSSNTGQGTSGGQSGGQVSVTTLDFTSGTGGSSSSGLDLASLANSLSAQGAGFDMSGTGQTTRNMDLSSLVNSLSGTADSSMTGSGTNTGSGSGSGTGSGSTSSSRFSQTSFTETGPRTGTNGTGTSINVQSGQAGMGTGSPASNNVDQLNNVVHDWQTSVDISQSGALNPASTVNDMNLHQSQLEYYDFSNRQYTKPCTPENLKAGRLYFMVRNNSQQYIQCDTNGYMHLRYCSTVASIPSYFDIWASVCVDGPIHVDNQVSKMGK